MLAAGKSGTILSVGVMELFLNKYHIIFPFFLGKFDFSISDFALTVLFVPLIVAFVMFIGSRKMSYYPRGLQNFVEIVYEACYNVFYGYLGQRGAKYIPFLFSLILFIFLLNVANLIPGLFACTSQLALTLSLSLMVFLLVVVIGFWEHGNKFWQTFIPPDLPFVLKPFLFILELFSFLIRPMSLALRLVINMVAGHVMLHIIGSFGAGIWSIKILAIAISSILSIFELVVAALQAYVFALLSCIYIADIMHGHED